MVPADGMSMGCGDTEECEYSPVRDGEYHFPVVAPLVRVVRVLHNQRTAKAIGILSHVVGVI
jgi:hypothetical protein